MAELLAPLAETIERDGFAFVRAPEMGRLLEEAGHADWEGFAATWGDLGGDAYMADGGRYRRRRFGVFRAAPGGITRKPHQPHYQSRDYNPLNGGVERWFEPVTEAATHHPALTALLPFPIRPADPVRVAPRSLACRDPPVPHRDAARPGGASDPGRHAP